MANTAKLYGWYLWRARNMDDMITTGWTYQEIADHYRLSMYQVRAMLKRYWSMNDEPNSNNTPQKWNAGSPDPI